jgi:putative beta-lysine N-acetyltransferase
MDTIETLHGSLVQHGPHNDRIYLMRLDPEGVGDLIVALEALARHRRYGKIFAKIPEPAWATFRSAGYIQEAVVPGLFKARLDGYFIAKYMDPKRQAIPAAEMRLERTGPRGAASADAVFRPGRTPRQVVACGPSDADAISRLYRQVFATYPFPVHRPGYLKRTMKAGSRYFAVRREGRMAAVAAAEIHRHDQYAEMTDFATRSRYRNQGLAGSLLRHMEKAVRQRGVRTAFTIARAASAGMNAVFRKNGYRYAGLLRNNTQIAGRLESMTVWYKPL